MKGAEIDEAWEVVRAGHGAGVLITCEHASERLLEPWRWSARDQRLVGTHWAYDLGAAELAREYAEAIGGVAVVFGLTVVWEIGEYLGDRVLDTALIPSKRDSAVDIAFGTLGGGLGVALAALVPARFWR